MAGSMNKETGKKSNPIIKAVLYIIASVAMYYSRYGTNLLDDEDRLYTVS